MWHFDIQKDASCNECTSPLLLKPQMFVESSITLETHMFYNIIGIGFIVILQF